MRSMTVVSSAGGFKINNSAPFPAIIAFNVGEAITETFYGNPLTIIDSTMVLNQGFEQPSKWIVGTLNPNTPSDIPIQSEENTKKYLSQSKIELFPNPYNDYLYVRKINLEANQMLKVFNSQGILCRSLLIHKDYQNLELEQLPPGTYYFEFINESDQSSTMKKQ